jgi:hypothetical protein
MTLEVRRKMVQRPFPEISMVRIHEPDPYSFDKKMRSILKNEAHRTMVRRMQFLWKNREQRRVHRE